MGEIGRVAITFAASLVFVFQMLTCMSGRWARNDDATDTAWWEMGLWHSCTCADILSAGCNTSDNYFRTLEGFAIMGAILNFVILVLMSIKLIMFPGTQNRSLSNWVMLLLGGSIVFSIVTWGTFAGMYTKSDLCGASSYKDRGYDLNWGYGLRFAEFAALLVALTLQIVVSCASPGTRKVDIQSVNKWVFVLVLFAVAMSIATTSSRGWMTFDNDSTTYQEFGLFDYCTCTEVRDLACDDRRTYLKVAEAFSVAAIFFQFFALSKMVFTTATHTLQLTLLALSTICQVLVLAPFAAQFNQNLCAIKLDDKNKLHWAFGLQVVSVAVSLIVFFGHWNTPTDIPTYDPKVKDEDCIQACSTEPTS